MTNKNLFDQSTFKHLEKLGYGILLDLLGKVNPDSFKKNPDNYKLVKDFTENYVNRYEETYTFIKTVSPLRLEAFAAYYVPDKIRRTKYVYFDNYTLKDYIDKLGVWGDKQEVISKDGTAFKKLKAQFQILLEIKDKE